MGVRQVATERGAQRQFGRDFGEAPEPLDALFDIDTADNGRVRIDREQLVERGVALE